MSQTAITTEVHQTLDVHCYFSSQIALYGNLRNLGANALDFRFSQVANSGFWRDLCSFTNL
jgi:hypothetical protein